MNNDFHYFKELLESFFAHEPAGSLSSASLLNFWLKQPAPNALFDLLASQNVDLKRFGDGLDAVSRRSCSDGDPWILQYISRIEDLDAVSSSSFLRDCIVTSRGTLRDLFEECAVSPELIATPREAGRRQRGSIIIQENAALAPQHLVRFGRDLVECARRGEFQCLVERETAFDQMLNVLRKSQKGNAIITGPAGTGKTALVECLANALAAGDLDSVLPRTRLFEFRLSVLLAGTQYRGMFEERLEQVIAEVERCQPVILFIDEIHLLWGAGRTSESAMDASNILKPHLARGAFRVIGATTFEDYRRYILRDPALARRFEEIRLTEPDPELTRRMVDRQLDGLKHAHGVGFETGCVSKAITLTNRHLPNRQQPDKAIDLLDTVAAKVTAHGRDQVLLEDLLQALEPLCNTQGRPGVGFSSEVVALRNRLAEQIFGQTDAVETVARALAMRKLFGGTQATRPLSFLFAGGSGVGKTLLAKNVAEVFYGNARQCLHLDLGEYSSPLSVSKILGAPGFTLTGEQGLLPAFLDTHPAGVLLFDEIEKAHPNISDMLLGLLDHGTATTASGHNLDASGCVLIATTNVLQPVDLTRNPIGFSGTSDDIDPRKALGEHFRVEFLNRFDDILIFQGLGRDTLELIVRKELGAYAELVPEPESETLVQAVLRKLGSQRDARAAKRAVQKTVEALLMAMPDQAVS